jgi:hypothetical protein
VNGGKPNLSWLDWAPGVPPTNAGDPKIVKPSGGGWASCGPIRGCRRAAMIPTAVPPPKNLERAAMMGSVVRTVPHSSNGGMAPAGVVASFYAVK